MKSCGLVPSWFECCFQTTLLHGDAAWAIHRGRGALHRGRAAQVDPLKPVLKAPGTMLCKLIYDEPLSIFAFKFNLHHYTADAALFPTYVFMHYILPRHFGWKDFFAGQARLTVTIWLAGPIALLVPQLVERQLLPLNTGWSVR